MNRIEAIVSFISNTDKVVDVGCDQVEVGVMLAKKGIKSIGADISNNVINKARDKVNKLSLNEYIDLRVSDGLINVNENEADTLVLAGMGAHTILNILKNTSNRYKKIITISNNKNDILRKEMNNLNYKVNNELIIKEKNKYYNLILFTPGNYSYTDKELLLGINHLNKELFNEWKDCLIEKYNNIIKSSDKDIKKISLILKYLEN